MDNPGVWAAMERVCDPSRGMTIREFVASMALNGLLASCTSGINPDDAAKRATDYADALLVRLGRVRPAAKDV
jgi:hypothetical protein